MSAVERPKGTAECVCCQRPIHQDDPRAGRWLHDETGNVACERTDEDGNHPFVAAPVVDAWLDMVISLRQYYMWIGVTQGK